MTATTNRLLVATFSTVFLHGIFLSYHFQQNRTSPTPLPSQHIIVSFGETNPPKEKESIRKQRIPPKQTEVPAIPESVTKKTLKTRRQPEKIFSLRKKQLTLQKEEIIEKAVETKAVSPPSREQTVSTTVPKQSCASARVIDYATPLYRVNPPPKYPRSARSRGMEGVVLLEVFVNIVGKVKEIKLLKSSGYAILDRAALKAVNNWRFSPGSVNGTLEAMRVRVPIHFRLN